jgi:dTDP-4-dehydrorhamnose 3,5-epimerase
MSQQYSEYESHFNGVVYRELSRFVDSRGTTTEFFTNRSLPENFRLFKVTQLMEATSVAGVIRGIHYSAPDNPQYKIVRCLRGNIKDIVVDLRPGSATFGEWRVFELSEDNSSVLFIPHGFGHAYEVVSSHATVVYALDTSFQFDKEYSIHPMDKDLSLPWTKQDHTLSEKDSSAKSFENVCKELLQFYSS